MRDATSFSFTLRRFFMGIATTVSFSTRLQLSFTEGYLFWFRELHKHLSYVVEFGYYSILLHNYLLQFHYFILILLVLTPRPLELAVQLS
jgi:hypothetical protein